MPLLHHRRLNTGPWLHAPDDGPLPAQPATVSYARWSRRDPGDAAAGVRLGAAADLEPLSRDLARVPSILIEIDHFADGRAFSTLRLLRERYGYRGEIRVGGDYLVDQIDALLRAGADSFELPDDMAPDDALRAVRLGGVSYQPGPDAARRPLPDRDGLLLD